MQALLGQEIGPSEWRTVTQADIDTFAELSGDDQWIHVDIERAKNESPFGGPIAHGNLTLSIIDGFREQLTEAKGFKLGVNYGWNKVRFPAPVPVGARIRMGCELLEVTDVPGGVQVITRNTVDIDGSDKPACVVEAISRFLF